MSTTAQKLLPAIPALSMLVMLLGSGPLKAEEARSGELQRGAGLWRDNCARCHNMRDPKEFRDDQWKAIVYHMRVRAGLTGQDTRDILRFLIESN